MKSETYNMDCMEYMRTLPDKAFDLAIVDPPYGNAGKNITLTRKAWADGYALGIMSTVECTFEGTMNCSRCKYSSEYNPEHKSQLVCKNNMVKQGMEIISKIGSEAKA